MSADGSSFDASAYVDDRVDDGMFRIDRGGGLAHLYVEQF